MSGYSAWGDLLDTYQSLPDWLKFMWLVVPPAFVLALVALLRHWPRPREVVRRETISPGFVHTAEPLPPALSPPPARPALPPAP